MTRDARHAAVTRVAADTPARTAAAAIAMRSVGVIDETGTTHIHWILRIGAGACFIGHGAFGVITKAAWVPYFAVAGIGSDAAYALMPVVGVVDIVMGILVLLSPRPAVLLYMTVWALWTALLRPFAGEPAFETMERAGNYGVPLALLLFIGWPRSWRGWLRRGDGAPADPATIARVLQWTTATLLFGHGALAAITQKALLTEHWFALGVAGSIAPVVGYAEMGAALLVLGAPSRGLLLGIAAWKVATEALFPIAGSPIWEFIERAGSYAAPLGLALLLARQRTTPHPLRERSR